MNKYRPLSLSTPFQPLFTHLPGPIFPGRSLLLSAYLPHSPVMNKCFSITDPPLFPWNQTPAWNLPALSSSPGVS